MKNGKHVTLKRIASAVVAFSALSAPFACGITPASDSEANGSTAQASTACQNPPGTTCTAQVVARSLSEAGYLFVQCPGTVGNGVYDLFLTSSLNGTWTQARDLSNPTGAIPYPNGSTEIQFNDVDEDNVGFPGGQIIATYVQICAAQSTNLCGNLEDSNPCVTVPVTLLPQTSGSSSGSSGSSSGSTGGSSSGGGSGSSSGIKGGGSSGGRCGKLWC
jgi:hypothetical protein